MKTFLVHYQGKGVGCDYSPFGESGCNHKVTMVIAKDHEAAWREVCRTFEYDKEDIESITIYEVTTYVNYDPESINTLFS